MSRIVQAVATGCSVAAVTAVAYLGLLGWDQHKSLGADGELHGPYDVWQIVVLVLVLAVVAAWVGRRHRVMVGAGAAAFALTVCFSTDAATSAQDDGLWPVGALFLFIGTSLGFLVVGRPRTIVPRNLRSGLSYLARADG